MSCWSLQKPFFIHNDDNVEEIQEGREELHDGNEETQGNLEMGAIISKYATYRWVI